MPLDYGTFEYEEKPQKSGDERRIYVSQTGSISVEGKHFRQTYAPEEFVALLRKIVWQKEHSAKKYLPVLSSPNKLKKTCGLILTLFCMVFLTNCASSTAVTDSSETAKKIVTVGGSATEIVYALGAGDKLVGVDTSSIYPEAATKLPQIGYQRTLSAEGVISLKPSLVIITPDAGPPPAIQQIESAGIRVVHVNNDLTPDGAKAKIRQIAEALNLQAKGEEVIKRFDSELSDAQKIAADQKMKPKVVFIYARGAGTVNVGGTETPADAMIKLAGGENPVTEFSQYKPLTPEALVAAQPDVILLPSRGLEAMGGIDAILSLPGVKETPAGKNKKIVAVDDMLLLGFTPRLGQGVKDLCEKIH